MYWMGDACGTPPSSPALLPPRLRFPFFDSPPCAPACPCCPCALPFFFLPPRVRPFLGVVATPAAPSVVAVADTSTPAATAAGAAADAGALAAAGACGGFSALGAGAAAEAGAGAAAAADVAAVVSAIVTTDTCWCDKLGCQRLLGAIAEAHVLSDTVARSHDVRGQKSSNSARTAAKESVLCHCGRTDGRQPMLPRSFCDDSMKVGGTFDDCMATPQYVQPSPPEPKCPSYFVCPVTESIHVLTLATDLARPGDTHHPHR